MIFKFCGSSRSLIDLCESSYIKDKMMMMVMLVMIIIMIIIIIMLMIMIKKILDETGFTVNFVSFTSFIYLCWRLILWGILYEILWYYINCFTLEERCSYLDPRVYPRGSIVIALVRGPSVHGPSLNISETALRIFLIFCMKLEHHKGTKVTEPDF